MAEVLARLRTRVPCRLQVTANGLLLHHFAVADIERLRSARRLGLGRRLLWWLFALAANFGATWLIVVGLWTGFRTLAAMGDPEGRGMLATAAQGLYFMVLLIALSIGAAYLVQVLVGPWRPDPKLAPALRDAPDDEPDAQGKPTTSRTSRAVDRTILDIIEVAFRSGPVAILFLIVISLILALMAGGLFLAYLWARGLWRATAQLGEPERDVSPRRWILTARKSPVIDTFMPTNELAMRIVRALQRAFAGKNADEGLPQRILNLAAQLGGSVSVVDLILTQGLAPQEALNVGAQLCARAGGEVLVSHAGDVDFRFPPEALRDCQPARPPPQFEYLNLAREEPLYATPLNVPGLTADHIAGAARLAGGPFATLVVLAVAGPVWGLTSHLFGPERFVAAGFCLLAPGTMMLAAAARALAGVSAHQGLLRDARRAALWQVEQGLAQQAVDVDPAAVAAKFLDRVDCADPSLTLEDVRFEVEVALSDLGLQLGAGKDGAAMGAATMSLASLRVRLNSLQTLRRQAHRPGPPAADAIVFDTGRG